MLFGITYSQKESAASEKTEKATFAGGCFWCIEPPFEKTEGVREVISGYTGGRKENPTYEEVSAGTTGHLEAVQITYEPAKVSYQKLLDIFWRQIDPTDSGGQFVDRGQQYRPAIFYHTPEQKAIAQKSRDDLQRSGRYQKPVVLDILPAEKFYPAEDYHQDYFKLNPGNPYCQAVIVPKVSKFQKRYEALLKEESE